MADWIQRKKEESYFNQLDEMLIQRLRSDSSTQVLNRSESRPEINPPNKAINKLSIEINEELDRLENLLREEESQ